MAVVTMLAKTAAVGGLALALRPSSRITWELHVCQGECLLTRPKKNVGAPVPPRRIASFCASPTTTRNPSPPTLPGEQSSEPTGELSSEPYHNHHLASNNLEMADTS